MACENQVGVKNVLITFRNCDTDEVIQKVAHEEVGENDFVVIGCNRRNEAGKNGKVAVSKDNATMTITVDRNPDIPLSYYQGCAAIDIQVEMHNGVVYTGYNGSVVDPDGSNGSTVTMSLIFSRIDEMLASAAA